MKVKLRKIREEDEDLFIQQSKEFEREGYGFAYKYEQAKNFLEYIEFVKNSELDIKLNPEDVPASYLMAENSFGEVVGRISIRHRLNDFLERIGGHIGYNVIKEYRFSGYGTEILKQGLIYADSVLELDRVLVTCDETNIGSRKIIEKNGGVYEDSYFGDEVKIPKRRYWIEL
jgi:predicted acetyltransferase